MFVGGPIRTLIELKIGDTAPEFNLIDERGFSVRLKDFLGKKIVVLYFYPKDFTSGCTTEACNFRDDYKAFKEKEAVVVSVSVDSFESHAKFSDKYNLPFALLSDNRKEVAKEYGVLGPNRGKRSYFWFPSFKSTCFCCWHILFWYRTDEQN